jgi:hypothetical protein
MARFTVVFTFLVGLLLFPGGPAQAYVPETESQAVAQQLTLEDDLVVSAGKGFAKTIRAENAAWYECGVVTPKEDYDKRGIHLAFALRVALLEVGLKDSIYLWGALALVYQESRGNPCVTGPRSREWALKNDLVRKEKHWTRFDKKDIIKMVSSKEFKKKRSGIDSGLTQTLFPHNTSMYDVTSRTVRPVSIEEMLTVEGGARATAYHMIERAKDSSRYPWLFWPGRRDDKYAEVLAFHVRRMGGPYNDMFPHCKSNNSH